MEQKKLEDHAKAYVKTSQNLIPGTDQFGVEFFLKLYERFFDFALQNADPKCHRYREVRSTRARLE